MYRKRLLSILSGVTLSLAGIAGPAVALEDPTGVTEVVSEDGAELETELVDAELDTEDVEATVEVVEEDVQLDPTDTEEPVKTSSDGDGDGGDLTDPVDDLLSDDEGSDPDPADDDGSVDVRTGSKDYRTAGDDTVQAPAPSGSDPVTSRGTVTPSDRYSYSYAIQRPAPAAAVAEPEVAAPAEPAPQVAPPRDGDEVVNLASTPITDPASAPTGLKVLAALLVAGTAMTWWHARDVVAESIN